MKLNVNIFVILTLFFWVLSCSDRNVAGGSVSTENVITGQTLDSLGAPLPHTQVLLRSMSYLPESILPGLNQIVDTSYSDSLGRFSLHTWGGDWFFIEARIHVNSIPMAKKNTDSILWLSWKDSVSVGSRSNLTLSPAFSKTIYLNKISEDTGKLYLGISGTNHFTPVVGDSAVLDELAEGNFDVSIIGIDSANIGKKPSLELIQYDGLGENVSFSAKQAGQIPILAVKKIKKP